MNAIDVHGHYGIYDRGATQLTDRMMSGDLEVVRRRARATGVQLTVVSPLRAIFPYGGDIVAGNEESLALCPQYEDIRFWVVIEPRLPQSFVQAESMLQHPHCCGIKIHPRDHNYEIRQYGDAIFDFANAHKSVVLTHSGDLGSYPEDFVPFVKRYSEMNLILAHLGNSDNGHFTRQVIAYQLAKTDNIYIDTSSIRSMSSGLIEWAVSQIGYDHILFGTDTPLYFTAAQKARVEYAEIDEAAKQAILFDNAARLLRAKIPETLAH